MKLRRAAVAESYATESTLVPDPAAASVDARLGDLAVEVARVPRPDVEDAIAQANGSKVGEALLRARLLDEVGVTALLAQQLGVPVADLRTAQPGHEAASLVTDLEAHHLAVLPLSFEGAIARVAVADPFDPEVQTLLRRLPVREVHVELAVPSHLRARVNQQYRALAEVASDVEAFHASDLRVEHFDVDDRDADDDAPVVQVVNKILTQALRDRASDVHIEPSEDGVRIRYRIDGALNDVVLLPAEMGPALVSRLKVMAGMNIVERRRPQDGQLEMVVDGRSLDVRVSTTSTIWGEKTVLRLLDRTRSLYRLADLGMAEALGERYARIVRSPFGMVVVSGPTGSGKTTTLYATLSEINRPDMNVMTIEDPVEYVFPRVNQVQISEQAGLSFATGLKSILRQDPDIILVGEMRDAETARIAVQSALTGHLVLSSVHATDSIAAMYRLVDMGVEPFLITSALTGVVAQRLVRRICSACAEPYEPSLQELAMYRKLGGVDKDRWTRGVGCTFCSGTGFFDRIGVYEVLALSDEVRKAVVEGQPPRAAREIAVGQGLSTLRTEAMRLVTDDVTTMDEVVRHVFVMEDFE
jgi:type IV pilus assembly protein PilB